MSAFAMRRQAIKRDIHTDHGVRVLLNDQFRQPASSSIRHENLDRAYDRRRTRRAEYERHLALSSTPLRFTVAEWIGLCDGYGNKCLCCKQENLDLTIDHVIPVSRGGRDSIDNIQPLCRSCNSAKGSKIIDYRSK